MNTEKDKQRHLLFVSSDQALVGRIRDQAGALEPAWRTTFVATADEANLAFKQGPIDVAVIDPGSNGDNRLLRQLARTSPTTGLMAVDRPGKDVSLQIGAPVRMMSTRIDAETLKAFAERSLHLRQLLNNPCLHHTAGDIDNLPTVPAAYWKITHAIAQDNVDMADIARIVETDPAMCLKILQIVNSAYFGTSKRTTSIAQAITMLGLNMLRGLVLVAHVFRACERADVVGFSLVNFQQYSLRVARLASAFVEDKGLADEAFTAGIVHDIGTLALSLIQPRHFEATLARLAEGGGTACEVEREILGVTHADVGALLVASWGIPVPVVECVAYHHRPHLVEGGPCELLAAVHAAEALVGIITCGDREDCLDKAFLARAGVLHELPRWRALVEKDCGLT